MQPIDVDDVMNHRNHPKFDDHNNYISTQPQQLNEIQ